jgi:hypothetical protein
MTVRYDKRGELRLSRRIFYAYALLLVGVVVAGYGAYHATSRVGDNYNEVQAGRRLSLSIICAFGGAVAEAGREVISHSVPTPVTPEQKAQNRALIKLGFPSYKERQEAAKLGGQLYVQSLSNKVEERTGITGLVVKKGPNAGSLNCVRLRNVAVTASNG